MRRRQFLALLGGTAAVWTGTSRAQKPPALIGFLASGAAASINSAYQVATIKRGLHDNGLVEGRDYVLEARFAAGNYQLFPEMARDLAAAGARVILANTIASVRAAQALVPSVPVVMVSINDPVGTGLVASLARPGGHTTGMATLGEDLTPKILDLLRTLLPNAVAMAVLYNPANPTGAVFLENLRGRAGALGLSVLPMPVRSRDELESAFASLPAQRPDAIEVIGDTGIIDLADRIAALAVAHKIPLLATFPDLARLGGLVAYGAGREQFFLRSAWYVKKILDGANPADLPVEQPARFELWINLKTAKALGIAVPASLLAVADQVFE
jgi:putative ABC transport system substrate-binding protein